MRNKPKIKINAPEKAVSLSMPDAIMARWQPEIHAASNDDDATINIYSVIGEDFWTGEGMTPKIVNGVLRKNKGRAITVNINSPGGSFFDGVAIYNLLREHDGEINVRIVGIAASAASVIALAGDTVQIAESGFFMIHNAWNFLAGNRHQMREMADTLEQFDESMVGVYTKHTGMADSEIVTMMDKETWISGKDAVDMGFATGLLDSDDVKVDKSGKASYNAALKAVDEAMAKAMVPRSERRRLIKNLTSTPGATDDDDDPEEDTPSADESDKTVNAMVAFMDNLKKHT